MNTTDIKVFKFGGASLKNVAAIRDVAHILKKYKGQPLMIVVSAMKGVTNQLEEVVASYLQQDGKAMQLLEGIKKEHYEVCYELFHEEHEILTTLNDVFVEVEWTLEEEPVDSYDFLYDQIVSLGELLCSNIVYSFLNESGFNIRFLDARDVIITDNIYRSATVLWEETQKRCDNLLKPLLKEDQIIISQGFIGCTTENFTTTLGREGSDYTAAIFAYCLDAESMSIWKDVPGVLTADPRFFDNVTKLERMSYKEAIEMTYYGAKVIHPKTIKPLQNKSIPLHVKSFVNPLEEGTFISDDIEDTYPPLVAVEHNQALLQLSTLDFSFVAEHHLSHIFSLLAELHIQVNLMQNTAISFVLCVNDLDGKIDTFVERIQNDFKVVLDRGLELISVRHYHGGILDSLKRGKIILIEERSTKTAQLVIKDVPMVRRK
ncbi:MAG: aspartate kinase [Bacteroidetes bacterium]|nr:MAG: aspartate kinase [Bacteroidota bacterium]